MMKTLLIMQLSPLIKKLALKLQTCVTNEVVYYLSSSKGDVWILLQLNLNYETKYKSSHIV